MHISCKTTSIHYWNGASITIFILMYLNLCWYVSIPTEYNIDGFNIPCSSVCKDLGITFSNDLSRKKHYKIIISKAYKSFGLLRRIFSKIHCSQAKKWLYKSIVKSTLLYCSSLWRPHQLNHIEAIEKLQRRTTKYILSDYISNYKSRLIQLGILPLMYIFELADIMFFIKSVKCPSGKFNILDYIEFNTSPTRSAKQKLRHKQTLILLWIPISIICLDCGTAYLLLTYPVH